MLRTASTRPAIRNLQRRIQQLPVRFSSSQHQVNARFAPGFGSGSLQTAWTRSIALRYTPAAVTSLTIPWMHRNKSDTTKYPHGKPPLTPTPGGVSAESTTHPITHELGDASSAPPPKDVDMVAGIKADLVTIRETFDLGEVPKEAYVLGLAGTLPYLGTSLATVFCAWDINYAEAHGTGWLLNEQSAETLLHLLEPLQVGYGAVILSFLGAIHWGLEWAGYGGRHGYPRYMIGLVAPVVAWPTTLMPIEYALVSQFLAFNFLYYADSRATSRGWMPPWYGTYRFVLTFVVGASIVLTLIGRGEIADRVRRLPGAVGRALKEEEGKVGQEKVMVTFGDGGEEDKEEAEEKKDGSKTKKDEADDEKDEAEGENDEAEGEKDEAEDEKDDAKDDGGEKKDDKKKKKD